MVPQVKFLNSNPVLHGVFVLIYSLLLKTWPPGRFTRTLGKKPSHLLAPGLRLTCWVAVEEIKLPLLWIYSIANNMDLDYIVT